MFLERLSAISSRIRHAEALSLVDEDGIPIESVNSNSDLDLEVLAAELIAQVRTIESNSRDLAGGSVRCYSVTTGLLTLMVSSVVQGYYLLLVLGRDGNYGRARFELRRARLLLEEDL